MTRRNLLKVVLAIVTGLTASASGKSKYRLRIAPYRCVGCRDCYRVCPKEGAIILDRGKAVINQTACTCCMLCESVCSYGAVERCEPYEN